MYLVTQKEIIEHRIRLHDDVVSIVYQCSAKVHSNGHL